MLTPNMTQRLMSRVTVVRGASKELKGEIERERERGWGERERGDGMCGEREGEGDGMCGEREREGMGM